MKKVLIIIVGSIIYLIVRVLRFFDIYFFKYPNAFGNQTLNVEYFVRKVKIISKSDSPIIFGIRYYEKSRDIANISLFDHHKRAGLKIISNKFICLLLNIGLTFQKEQIEKKGGRISTSFMTSNIRMLETDAEVHLLSDIGLPFDSDELSTFDNLLERMNLRKNEYYIVLHRGSNYRKMKSKMKNSDKVGFSYESQHSPLEIQYKAAKEMKHNGISAVKMGNRPIINYDKGGIIIDYPSVYRDSLGDIADLALANGCKFYVGTTSGVYGLMVSLKKPSFLCNTFPWPWSNIPMQKNSIVMPKKYWLVKEKRMMTLVEMINLEKYYSMKDISFNRKILDSLSIELVSNTEDEILDGVKEINNRIDGDWNGLNYSLSRILRGQIGEVSKSYLSTSFAQKNPDIMVGINPDN